MYAVAGYGVTLYIPAHDAPLITCLPGNGHPGINYFKIILDIQYNPLYYRYISQGINGISGAGEDGGKAMMITSEILKAVQTGRPGYEGYFVRDNVCLWYSSIYGWYVRVAGKGCLNIPFKAAHYLVKTS